MRFPLLKGGIIELDKRTANGMQIDGAFIDNNTSFKKLVELLRQAFASKGTLIPPRHHHDFPNPLSRSPTTLLLMPAWNPGQDAGVKIVTISPDNGQFDLPAINGVYIYLDAVKGEVKAVLEAKSLTAKRTAATSALASSYLSRSDASSLLMIGTGALSTNLIKAHASVRPITEVFVWGRRFEKAEIICDVLRNEHFRCTPIENIEEKVSEVAIISCATLSKTPLVLGKNLCPGQHIDLVGAYDKSMQESDEEAILKSSVYLDSFEGGIEGSGDIAIPIEKGILKEEAIKADLFQLCSNEKPGRLAAEEITLFKSVGHALEDIVAANYYYKQYNA